MVLFRRAVAILSAIALAFVALPTQAATPVDTKYVEGTDPAAAMFNPLVVNRINLSLPQATVNGLDGTTNYWGNEGPYLPAQLSAEINGILAVSVSDQRLTTLEREAIRAIGERLYGGAHGKGA